MNPEKLQALFARIGLTDSDLVMSMLLALTSGRDWMYAWGTPGMDAFNWLYQRNLDRLQREMDERGGEVTES